jgi:hypothetical protein
LFEAGARTSFPDRSDAAAAAAAAIRSVGGQAEPFACARRRDLGGVVARVDAA